MASPPEKRKKHTVSASRRRGIQDLRLHPKSRPEKRNTGKEKQITYINKKTEQKCRT
jgi:hypothetical protein